MLGKAFEEFNAYFENPSGATSLKLDKDGKVDYDDLSESEKATYRSMMEARQQAELSVSDIKKYMVQLKNGLEKEIATHTVDPRDINSLLKDAHMKARLNNYLILEGIFENSEFAIKQLDEALNRVKMK